MRGHLIRRSLVGLTGAVLSVAISSPASAAAKTCELVVSPAQTEQDNSSNGPLHWELHLQDSGGTACSVSLSVQALSHGQDGTPRYATSKQISDAWSVDATKFSIEPGQRRTVNVSGSIPAGSHSSYFALLASYEAEGQASATSVETRTQIASQFLLRGPKPWDQTTKVTDVGFLPGGDAKHRIVYATVANLGNVHVRPTGYVDIKQKGKTIARVQLERARASNPPLVLPGLSRRYTGVWEPTRPVNGSVDLQATITGAGKTTKFGKSISFVKGAPLTSSASLTLEASGDGGAHVTATVQNTGNQALSGVVVHMHALEDGKFERATEVLSLKKIDLGASLPAEWRPALAKGNYVIKAEVMQGGKTLDEGTTSLQLGTASADKPKAKHNRVVLVVIALAMVLLAASGSVMALRQTGFLRH